MYKSEIAEVINMWYCAHALLMYYYENDEPSLRGHENMYLINSDSIDLAFEAAELRARQDELLVLGQISINEKPAILKFAGIRKLVMLTIAQRVDGQISTTAQVKNGR